MKIFIKVLTLLFFLTNNSYANDKFLKVAGYTLQEVIGKNHNVVNSGYHPKKIWQDMYKTVIK